MKIKIKIVIGLGILLLILFGILRILHNYDVTSRNVKEGANNIVDSNKVPNQVYDAPQVSFLKLTQPGKVSKIVFFGNTWIHLNSLLFITKEGKLLQWDKDYYHTASKSPSTGADYGHWGDKSPGILMNTNLNQNNTFWHSVTSTKAQFTTIFTPPIDLAKIYIRNRMAAENSGGNFRYTSWGGCNSKIK